MAPINKLLAQTKYRISGPGPEVKDMASAPGVFDNFISQLIGVLTLIAIIYFIIQIIFAGYSFMGGGNDPKKIEQAKIKLTQNILGLTIVFVTIILTSVIGKLFGLNDILNFSENFTNIFK